jgi:hypothetical protein
MHQKTSGPVLAALTAGCALLLVLAPGCGGGSGNHIPVEGKVYVGTQPMAKGSVVYHPDKKKANTSPHEARGQVENGV